jgi:hypothetical protein
MSTFQSYSTMHYQAVRLSLEMKAVKVITNESREKEREPF